MAMSRDGLMSDSFLKMSRFDTPIWGIILTGIGMTVIVVAFGAGAIAKLASAFVLVKLALVNLAVIVLRGARINSYAPGFRSPLFPYLHIFGIILSIYLIFKLGILPIVLVCVSIAVTMLWFHYFGSKKLSKLLELSITSSKGSDRLPIQASIGKFQQLCKAMGYGQRMTMQV